MSSGPITSDELVSILRNVEDGITAQGPDGALVYANDAAARLCGLASAEEMLSLSGAELLERFEIIGEDGEPLSIERLPNRRAFVEREPQDGILGYRVRSSGEERWSLVRATPTFTKEGELGLVINLFHDITEERAAHARLRFLAEAGTLLSSSLDYEATLADLARLLVPRLADYCIVDGLESDMTLRQLVISHRNPAKEDLLRELRRRYPPETNDAHPVSVVLRSAAPLLIEDARFDALERAAVDAEHLSLYQALEAVSYIVVPLEARGRLPGTISLGTGESGRRFEEEDLELAHEIARRAALAIDNARLVGELRRRAQAAQALEFVGDGVFLIDRQGVVRLWNPAAARITGFAEDDIVGIAAETVLAGWPLDGAGERPLTFPIEGPERELWLSLTAAEFPHGTVYAFRDLTEEHALEQLRSDFVSTVSHELRTPLAAIYGAAMTLQREDVELQPEQQREMLAVVSGESERLARIVNDILLASRLDSGAATFKIGQADARELARGVLASASAHLPPEIELVLSAPDPGPEVAADPDGLRQVLVNLVENAVKYSPEGGRVVLELEPVDGRVRFAVRDGGLGIPASEHERIFEKFFRLDPNLSRGVGGTGLGLYIGREIMRRMGSRIRVESERGRGSTFSFELPLA